MKKIINPVPNAGAPWSNDTIQGVLNGEVWTALESILQGISPSASSGNVGVIVSGCKLTLNGAGPNYDCSSGIVYLSGQFMSFAGFSNQALPQYIYPASLVTTQKTFYDGVSRSLITEQDASYQSSAPGSGQYILLTTMGGARIEQSFGQTPYFFTTNGSGSLQTMATIATSSSKNFIIEITLIANRVSGGSAGYGSWTKISAAFKNVSGTLTQIGSNDVIYNHLNDASSPVISLSISSSNILIQVTPGSGVVYNCFASVKIISI